MPGDESELKKTEEKKKLLLKTITNSIWVFSCVRGDDTTTSEKIYILPT